MVAGMLRRKSTEVIGDDSEETAIETAKVKKVINTSYVGDQITNSEYETSSVAISSARFTAEFLL